MAIRQTRIAAVSGSGRWGGSIDREGREVGFVGNDPPFRPDRVEHDHGGDREREHEDDVPVGDRREKRREQDRGGDHAAGRPERRCALLPTGPMRDMAARRDRRADEVTAMQRGSRRELPDRLVARRAPREIGEKWFGALPAGSWRGHGHLLCRPEPASDEGSRNPRCDVKCAGWGSPVEVSRRSARPPFGHRYHSSHASGRSQRPGRELGSCPT